MIQFYSMSEFCLIPCWFLVMFSIRLWITSFLKSVTGVTHTITMYINIYVLHCVSISKSKVRTYSRMLSVTSETIRILNSFCFWFCFQSVYPNGPTNDNKQTTELKLRSSRIIFGTLFERLRNKNNKKKITNSNILIQLNFWMTHRRRCRCRPYSNPQSDEFICYRATHTHTHARIERQRTILCALKLCVSVNDPSEMQMQMQNT